MNILNNILLFLALIALLCLLRFALGDKND